MDTRLPDREDVGGWVGIKTFSPDSKLLVCCGIDGSIRIWDIISSTLINWVTVEKPVTSICFHPNNLFIATTHAMSSGIHIWVNRLLFQNIHLDRATKPKAISMPSTSSQEEKKTGKDAPDEMDIEAEAVAMDTEKKELSAPEEKLVTLSGLARPRWANIPNIDIIKARNKIKKEAPRIEAPFFLATLSSINPTFVAPTSSSDAQKEVPNPNSDEPKSRIIQASSLLTRSPLMSEIAQGNSEKALGMLMSFNPSQIDVELRTMSLANNFENLKILFRFLDEQIATGNNFEFLEAVLNLALKIHSTVVYGDSEVRDTLKKLEATQQNTWKKIESLFESNLCMVRFLSEMQQ